MDAKKWASVISAVASVVVVVATSVGNWAKDVNAEEKMEKLIDKKLKDKGM